MNQQLLSEMSRQYAIDELRSVDCIEQPTEAQIKAKLAVMMEWPLMQAIQLNVTVKQGA